MCLKYLKKQKKLFTETFDWEKWIWELQSIKQAREKLGSQWAWFEEDGDYQNQICWNGNVEARPQVVLFWLILMQMEKKTKKTKKMSLSFYNILGNVISPFDIFE